MPNDVHALCLIFQQIARPVRSENIKKESQVSYRTVLNVIPGFWYIPCLRYMSCKEITNSNLRLQRQISHMCWKLEVSIKRRLA